MIQNNNQNIFIYLDANNLYGYPVSKFLLTDGFKSIVPNGFSLNKYNSNS